MLDGFWTVYFEFNGNSGSGVITIANGKASGGDSSFTYKGELKSSPEGKVKGQLNIDKYNEIQGPLIPGMYNYSLYITGHINGDRLNLKGRVIGQTEVEFPISGKRVSEVTVFGKP